MLGEGRGHGAPALTFERFDHFAVVGHRERRHQVVQFTRHEQVRVGLRTPPEVALGDQEGLHQERPARCHERLDVGEAGAVQIVERQHHVEGAQLGPGRREVGIPPIDIQPAGAAQLPSPLERRGVIIDRHDRAPEHRRSDRVPPFPARQVEHPHPRSKEMIVPGEPGAGPGELGHDRGRRSTEIVGHRTSVTGLGSRPWDLLVIGGGVVGAGIARDAAMRGLRVVLVERGDLGAGTSSHSSRLVHGGLRYLEHGDFRLVFEALHERAILRRIAPHLVHPLAFVFPVHRGDRVPLWKLLAGMWLYDLLAVTRNVRAHRMLGKRALLRAEPMVRERGLVGGARYWDCQVDDARLTLATARSAEAHGAALVTYAEVEGLERSDGRVVGARLVDRLDGGRATVSATVVVNATGPWSDALRQMEDPAAPPVLRLTRGAHVLVRRARLGHTDAITLTSAVDGRVMFVLPWGEWSYVGTTDTDHDGGPDNVQATAADITYLLRSANAAFPTAHLLPEDVVTTWAGVRPLVRNDAALSTAAVSREHVIFRGNGGMFSIVGGKLTTYRRMAAEMVDRVSDELRRIDGRPRPPRARTDLEPLPGGTAADLSPLHARALETGLTRETADHLVARYGDELLAVVNLVAADRRLAERIHPTHPAIAAEVLHVTRRELARTVEDVLVRRLHLYYETSDAGLPAAGVTARLMGEVLGWEADEVAAAAERYTAAVRSRIRGMQA